jgi:hypothetical protein
MPSRPTCGATAAPRAGRRGYDDADRWTRCTCSTWCATSWRCCTHSAARRCTRWSATTSARRWRPGARWCGPMCLPRGGADERALCRPAVPGQGHSLARPRCWTPSWRRCRARAATTSTTTPRATSAKPRWTRPQGLHAFLRAYYHIKSADWPHNDPHPLPAMTGEALAAAAHLLRDGPRPRHGRDGGAAHAHAGRRSPPAAGCPTTSWRSMRRIYAHRPAGRAAVVPQRTRPGHRRSCASLPAGASRCRAASSPAARTGACTRCPAPSRRCRPALADLRGCHLIDGAGHWVQQEQADTVSRLLLDFVRSAAAA